MKLVLVLLDEFVVYQHCGVDPLLWVPNEYVLKVHQKRETCSLLVYVARVAPVVFLKVKGVG